jgi:hypothetical protein
MGSGGRKSSFRKKKNVPYRNNYNSVNVSLNLHVVARIQMLKIKLYMIHY